MSENLSMQKKFKRYQVRQMPPPTEAVFTFEREVLDHKYWKESVLEEKEW